MAQSSDSSTDQTISIAIACLCRQHTFTAPSVPVSSLPLKATTCHCDSCRYSTGALYASDAPWPGDPGEVRNASSLARYAFSDLITILFCGTCGSTLFFEEKPRGSDAEAKGEPSSFGVFTGALPNVQVPGGGPLVAWTHHMFLGDTRDGGASPWLRTLNYTRDSEDGGRASAGGCKFATSRRWLGRRLESDEIPQAEDWPPITTSPSALEDLSAATKDLSLTQDKQAQQQQQQDDDDITIPVRCRCGGVDLELLASAASREFSQMPRAQLPRIVDPHSNKPIASFDVCDSCRLVSGVDIFHWTFYQLRHIAFAKGNNAATGQKQQQDGEEGRGLPKSTAELKKAVLADEAERDPRLGTLRLYASSPDVQRYFCGKCSAVVFYAVDDLPDQVDVALGLLRAPPAGQNSSDKGGHGGARAEHLLSWKYGGKMGWRQDTEGGWRDEMLKIVERDVTAWRDRRGLQKNWRIINEEKEVAAKKGADE
ncbi:hypothetical protein Micbo1qcDRAFT_166635 [Microdochium bolleyi]|uniref:CENP-V/GFA domain-containing protein n=1 Tax=Microdochium bolleyi TaxID=196109 RepID=A0A136IUK1_9PEZI|nr:hypothetical protein Micbo1qcDRAFT_166635 [Microdochium bolleyi]